jgi:hydroxyacylglutathione hydrolase
MIFHQRFIPGLAIASYLVGDEKTKEAAVIDPTRDVDEFIRIAKHEQLKIAHVLETHVHADFVSGAVEMKHRCSGEPIIHVSGMGGDAWTPKYADHVVKDGDEVAMGALRFRALHTPGHTPEHLTWALFDETRSKDTPWLLFTGDFLFVGDVGRPDLLGEQERAKLAHQLYESVFKRISPLPDFTEVFPSHGAGSLCGKAIGSRRSSSLGFERRFNPSLRPMPEGEWTSNLLDGMPPAPPYFRRMKAVNAAGPAVLASAKPGQRRVSASEVQQHLSDWIVLDARPKESFAAAHIPGSLSIALAPNLPTWAGWILPYDRPIVILAATPYDAGEVNTHLLRVGFDHIEGVLEGGIDEWLACGFDVAHLATMSVQELAAALAKPPAERPFVLDVRTDGEWDGGHITGATHVQLGALPNEFAKVPKDRPVAVTCGTGYRSTIASSILQRNGYREITNIVGGMGAWTAAKLPTVK